MVIAKPPELLTKTMEAPLPDRGNDNHQCRVIVDYMQEHIQDDDCPVDPSSPWRCPLSLSTDGARRLAGLTYNGFSFTGDFRTVSNYQAPRTAHSAPSLSSIICSTVVPG